MMNDEQTLAFIDLYRQRPSLWDSKHSDYKNRNMRHDALMEIAVSFGIEKLEVEKKIKNLQSQFAREKKKENETKKTGSGADEPYVSKWFAYEAMKFLAEKNKPRNTVDNVEDPTADGEGENEEEDKDLEVQTNQDEASSQASTSQQKQAAAVTPTKQPKTKHFKSPTTTKGKKRKLAANNLAPSAAPILHEAMDLMRSIQLRKVDSKDEYSLFGEQVAMKLRRLSCPRTRFMVQNAINQALFDAEMGMYENHSAQRGATYGNMQPFTSTTPFPGYSSSYLSPTGIPLSQVPTHSAHPSHSPSPSYSQSSASHASTFADDFLDQYSQDGLNRSSQNGDVTQL